MPSPNIVVPPSIAAFLPSLDHLRRALADAVVVLPAGTRLFRAVRHPAAVVPAYVQQTYRFGPPEALRGPDGQFSLYWLYAAQDLLTALWESGFCTNDMTQPGTFYIPAAVTQSGLLVTFTLQEDLRIVDLHGTALSKLGIYDRIHGDHDWCQWFGLQMFDVLDGLPGGAVLGFRYPSRKHKNHGALAVSSEALDRFRNSVGVQVTPFALMPHYEALRSDANYADPMSGHFSID
ncbi:RES family NAD+ phosphorylase [Cupriavidus sp. AU9028]|uniref:RES family NAD+ phosphorylase n=1 Tax=Cupriavidus sp. AU9028 TaxID=2871157 RepID=UPI001C942744|nr:RES family NAD+ phosphorylase [Cupriavidus sp. AU9028]MBY4899243.1 RES family NAD+ phosphorylase [Cupriavidus sp. AU9028]